MCPWGKDSLLESRETLTACVCAPGLHDNSLYRALRAAVNYKVLEVAPGGHGQPPRFANTAVSDVLRRKHPRTAWPMVCSLTRSSVMLWYAVQSASVHQPVPKKEKGVTAQRCQAMSSSTCLFRSEQQHSPSFARISAVPV